MGLKILCSGHLIRHPVGGHTWHHLQYLVGLETMGHEVTFFENYGWPNSCYNPSLGAATVPPARVCKRFGHPRMPQVPGPLR